MFHIIFVPLGAKTAKGSLNTSVVPVHLQQASSVTHPLRARTLPTLTQLALSHLFNPHAVLCRQLLP